MWTCLSGDITIKCQTHTYSGTNSADEDAGLNQNEYVDLYLNDSSLICTYSDGPVNSNVKRHNVIKIRFVKSRWQR